MTDEALQPTGTTGSAEVQAHSGLDNETQIKLTLFAAVLLDREPSESKISTAVLRARFAAASALGTGRQSLAHERTLPFTLLYKAWRSDAAAVRPRRAIAREGGSAERAYAALSTLRHRQRSALALRYIARLEEAEVAEVIGVRPAEIHAILESATAGVARAMGTPVDLPAALGRAGAKMAASVALPTAAPRATVSRLPRSVVRTLIESPAEPSPPRNDLPLPVPPRESSPRPIRRRMLLAAALGVVLIAALAPAVAHVTRPGAIGIHPVPVRAPATVVAARPAVRVAAVRLTTVAPGDSLWLIAERTLGNPYRWPELWRANRGHIMANGERFADPNLIRPGWRLVLVRR